MGDIQHLELAILIAGIEYELAVVGPLQSVEGGHIGLHATFDVALLVVLHHHGVNLFIGVGNGQLAEIKGHRQLLVALVGINIGIGGGTETKLHALLGHHEFGYQHLAVVIVFVEHMQAVIAAHLELATVVGQLQLVVGVGNDGVAGVFVVVDGVAVESCQPIALEDALAGGPVGLAMFQLVDVTVVIVG